MLGRLRTPLALSPGQGHGYGWPWASRGASRGVYTVLRPHARARTRRGARIRARGKRGSAGPAACLRPGTVRQVGGRTHGASPRADRRGDAPARRAQRFPTNGLSDYQPRRASRRARPGSACPSSRKRIASPRVVDGDRPTLAGRADDGGCRAPATAPERAWNRHRDAYIRLYEHLFVPTERTT